jgi:hypothetical protein
VLLQVPGDGVEPALASSTVTAPVVQGLEWNNQVHAGAHVRVYVGMCASCCELVSGGQERVARATDILLAHFPAFLTTLYGAFPVELAGS